MAQFQDMETTKKLHVIPEYLRKQYLEILNSHMERIRKELSAARIDYCLMDTSKPLDAALFSYLAARSKST
jgi:phage terminase Nu1 subunit (DNA packaging protein)